MLSASEIRNVKFAKAMGGYKQEDVDIFLDKIEADYAQFERTVRDFQLKVEKLEKEIEEHKASQDSIQTVLLNAQRLADKIVNEAKEKSEEIIRNAEANINLITAHEKELSSAFELKAQERKNLLEKELADMVKAAQIKADSINAATQDCINRQQILFDRLKLEIATFKSQITVKYKEHLEILGTIPDTVPTDPKRIAEMVSAVIDKEPDINSFIPKKEEIKEDTEVANIDFDMHTEEENQGFVLDNTLLDDQNNNKN